MRHIRKFYTPNELRLGFKGRSCSFEHRAVSDRSGEALRAYIKLHDDLLANGMTHPLITYKGAVLIGMRRFEIMRDRMSLFPCVEILEEVENWNREDIQRLNDFKRELYGDDLEKFVG